MDVFIYYGLIFIAFLVSFSAQTFISYAYGKNSKVRNKSGLSGKDAARIILDSNGLSFVKIKMVNGYLTDHYDPIKKEVRLSRRVYNDESVASVAVASHECGHAIQDKDNYLFLRIRSSIIPLVNFSSYAGYLAIVIGLIFGLTELTYIGIILECVILLFQLITLPVEINASKRALNNIKTLDLLDDSEKPHARVTLIAAALTYVASVISAITDILRLILLYGRRDD